MAFKKGDPNINRKGRFGPNHSTKKMKEAFAMLVEDNLNNLSNWLEEIAVNDPKAAMEIVIKLSERFVPALARTEITAKDGDSLFKELRFNFGPSLESPDRIQELEEGDNYEDL